MDSDDLELFDLRSAIEEGEEELRPTLLYTVGASDKIGLVSLDRLSAKYTGDAHGEGIFQADIPAPTKCMAYYFEVLIKNAGEKGEITIGFSKEYIAEGLKLKSCGYIGNNGLIHGEDDQTVVASTTFTTNDIVGCGINSLSHEFFFTKNGLIVGAINRLVKSYLHHFGYEASFKAFKLAASNRHAEIGAFEEYDLHQRKHIKELIMDGAIDAAIAEVKKRYPQLIEGGSEAYCVLVCQKIIELVRKGAIAEVKAYANEELNDFRDSDLLKDLISDCSALLNCENLEEPGAEYLLEETQKEIAADTVNQAILSTNPDNKDQPPTSLERVLRQVGATCSLYRS